jgi:hypothetical protein
VPPGREVERERTYVLDPADAPAVHRILAPPGGLLLVGDRSVAVQARPTSVVLHVYTRTDWAHRRRVLIELTGRRRIRLSEKTWVAGAPGRTIPGDGPAKLDRRRRISEVEAWAELAGRWRVGFVKARFPLGLTVVGEDEVLLARIDVMCPVGAAGELLADGTFAHLEIEARSDRADPGLVERDPVVWATLAAWLAPLDRPKADVAAEAGAAGAPAWSATETAARVRAIDRAVPDLMGRQPYAGLAAQHARLAPPATTAPGCAGPGTVTAPGRGSSGGPADCGADLPAAEENGP